MRVSAVALLATMLAAGCGEGTRVGGAADDGGPPPVSAPTATGTPYAGPMHVAVADPDHRDVRKRSGAAGRAVECSGELWNGSTGANWGLHRGYPDPDKALQSFTDQPFGSVPATGYHVERKEPGRVLYSYDVDGRTKVAVIVSNLVPPLEGEGWSVDTFAMCDPAEWPAEVTDKLALGVWSDRDGKRVPTSIVLSLQGPEHCDWESATFLRFKDKTYYRDPKGVLPAAWFETKYAGRVALPDDAKDTGYRKDGQQLWLAADKKAVYVVSGDRVERWPAPVEPGGCA